MAAPARPFVLVGRARTGTSWLRGLLASHPRIRVFGELFAHRERPSTGLGELLEPTPERLARLLDDPIPFLEGEIFRADDASLASGFKLLYRHAPTRDPADPWTAVRPHLARRPGLRVIHLTRRDLLRTHLSERRAEITGLWKLGAHEEDPFADGLAFPLEPEACRRAFEHIRRQEAEHRRLFAAREVLEVAYEDLDRNPGPVLGRVLAHLGLDPAEHRRLTPATRRQARFEPWLEITNFDRLAEHFRGGEWEELFERRPRLPEP